MSPAPPSPDATASPAADAAVLGIDNVRLELPLAGLGSRSLAAIVDYALFLILMGVVWTAGILTLGFLEIGEGWILGILTLISFAIQWSYFAVLEIVMGGQTPGKSLLDIRVVAHHGGQPSTGALVIRNLIRAVDVIFGLPTIALDQRFRRFGDMAGGTVVVHERGDEDEIVLKRAPSGWGANEIALVESFLRRAELMEPQRAEDLAGKLLHWIDREHPGMLGETGAKPSLSKVENLRRLLLSDATPGNEPPPPRPAEPRPTEPQPAVQAPPPPPVDNG